MEPIVRQILCRIVAQYGAGLSQDMRLCSALLKDFCGQHKREINVLIAAGRARVGIDLLAASPLMPRPAVIALLTRRLCDDLAMAEDAALWAVESWALALGAGDCAENRPASFALVPGDVPPAEPLAARTNPVDGADMLWIPAGEFLMGDDDVRDNPRRRVALDGYWIYKIPVTVAQYRAFCQTTRRAFPEPPEGGWRDDHPVVNVTWNDAGEYAGWAGVRLPSEAQWEKAARGSDGRLYPWGERWEAGRCAHSVDSVRGSAAPAGSFCAGRSPYGVLDMAGNVWEWCANSYDESSERSASSWSPPGGERRVLRGGSWNDTLPFLFRTAMRFRYSASERYFSFGFRCAAPDALLQPPSG